MSVVWLQTSRLWDRTTLPGKHCCSLCSLLSLRDKNHGDLIPPVLRFTVTYLREKGERQPPPTAACGRWRSWKPPWGGGQLPP